MTLSGLGASPMASAASSQTVAKSFTFPTGSSDLTKSQKTKIKKAVATAGKNATFRVTGTAGKLPGVSDSTVRILAKKRGQVIKAYLIKLSVKKSHVTIKLKITGLGIVPKTRLVGTYTASKPTPTASPTTPALTCGNGGTCVLGGPGTGGGIIFYVDSSVEGFACGPTLASTCHYLEVAPSGWNNGGITPEEDPQMVWAVTANQGADVPDITNETSANNTSAGIGLGYKNSVAIENQNGIYDASTNKYAAGAARSYRGGTRGNWYLPTTAELNLLCQWNRGVPQDVTIPCTTGTGMNSGIGASGSGLIPSHYWTSSGYSAGTAWRHRLDFNQGYYGKDGSVYVRPVRAF